MKVLFDLLTIRYSLNSGIFIYATRILDGWYSQGIKDVVVLTSQYCVDICKSRWPIYNVITINIPNSGYTRKGLFVGKERKKMIAASGCDIVFYPMPEPLFYQKINIPQITVIHDMLAPKIAKGKNWLYHNLLLPYQIWHCKDVITISNYTKTEVLKGYPFLKKRKLPVIYNSIDWSDDDVCPVLEGEYILCINVIAPYKNGITLAKAFGQIKDSFNGKLVFVGKIWGDYWEQIEQVAKNNNYSERLLHLEDLSNEDIISLYQHATLFVTPSTMEGFGQTPIEAAIYKCPVLSSTCTALPESTMGLVNYYQPVNSEEALAKEMRAILRNKPSLDKLECISIRMKNAYDKNEQSMKVYNFLKSCL